MIIMVIGTLTYVFSFVTFQLITMLIIKQETAKLYVHWELLELMQLHPIMFLHANMIVLSLHMLEIPTVFVSQIVDLDYMEIQLKENVILIHMIVLMAIMDIQYGIDVYLRKIVSILGQVAHIMPRIQQKLVFKNVNLLITVIV